MSALDQVQLVIKPEDVHVYRTARRALDRLQSVVEKSEQLLWLQDSQLHAEDGSNIDTAAAEEAWASILT